MRWRRAWRMSFAGATRTWSEEARAGGNQARAGARRTLCAPCQASVSGMVVLSHEAVGRHLTPPERFIHKPGGTTEDRGHAAHQSSGLGTGRLDVAG